MSKERKIKVDKNKRIGKGGFGDVFEGKFEGQQVAVKRVINIDLADDRESEALQRLKHLNVVELLYVEHGEDFK